jgi:hypothetical protein
MEIGSLPGQGEAAEPTADREEAELGGVGHSGAGQSDLA